MASLDAAADPRFAIERGLYVPRAGRSLVDAVAGRLELQPASTHLVVGGIGSGKTTQLLMAAQRLSKVEDTLAEYVDVSALHDIGSLQSKVLLVLAGLRLVKKLKKDERAELSDAIEEINHAAHGYTYFHEYTEDDYDQSDYEPPDEPPGEYVRIPGILNPPSVEKPKEIGSSLVKALNTVKKKIATRIPHIVFLFDSLDRLTDATGFEQVVLEDTRVLRSIGIGVVLVGPLKLLYGAYRPITQRFDALYQVQWSDPDVPDGRNFLLQVLKARAPDGLLSDEGASRLVELSGGVLRDLVGIARNAGEEAYLSGDEQISATHSGAAGEAFGRTLLLGLDPDDITKLQAVRMQGSFVPVSDKDLALLMTGRVLEYQGPRTRYAVHPTIRPLLEQLSEQP